LLKNLTQTLLARITCYKNKVIDWAASHRGAAIVAIIGLIIALVAVPLDFLDYIELFSAVTPTPTSTPSVTPSPTFTLTPTPTATPNPPTPTPTPRPYVGHVFDAETGDPIEGAEVHLTTTGAPAVVYTDSEGVFRFTLPEEKALSGLIYVEAKGYKRQSRRVEILPNRLDLEDFRLERTPVEEGGNDEAEVTPIQRNIVLCPNDNDMVFVDRGPFVLGSTPEEIEMFGEQCPAPNELEGCSARWFEDELPQRKIQLDAFCIDMFEVTNSEFARFVEETGYETTAEKRGNSITWNEKDKDWNRDMEGASWRHPHGPDTDIKGLENHPVVQVSFEDAQAYCDWEGKQLPTGEEWEKAARGTEGYIYPWGNYWDGNKLNYYERRTPGTEEVGQYPDGASYYGAEDMLGNVLEWVTSQNPNNSSEFDTRGGGWGTVRVYLHAAWHNYVPSQNTTPTAGFRCARSYLLSP
jgi:formylglycine-generating enzyme required for sulfatase activity